MHGEGGGGSWGGEGEGRRVIGYLHMFTCVIVWVCVCVCVCVCVWKSCSFVFHSLSSSASWQLCVVCVFTHTRCVNSFRMSSTQHLVYHADVKLLEVKLDTGQVIVESTLTSDEVKSLIESTGRLAVLLGMGGSNGEWGWWGCTSHSTQLYLT